MIDDQTEKMKGYIKIRKKILGILNTKLPNDLSYHNLQHTLDSLYVCNQYVRRVGLDHHSAKLLRLGVLLHDIGFSVSKKDHEVRGIEIAKDLMKEFNFSNKDIAIVTGLIMATCMPQNPKNQLERIICDIDLDYLGRDDFYPISNNLYKELQTNLPDQNKSAWNKIQIEFLKAHRFHTDFAKRNRQPKKEQRIAELKLLVLNSK